jgi:hypothetical protein
MRSPAFDHDPSFVERVKDFAVEQLGLRQQVHQVWDCVWAVDFGFFVVWKSLS